MFLFFLISYFLFHYICRCHLLHFNNNKYRFQLRRIEAERARTAARRIKSGDIILLLLFYSFLVLMQIFDFSHFFVLPYFSLSPSLSLSLSLSLSSPLSLSVCLYLSLSLSLSLSFFFLLLFCTFLIFSFIASSLFASLLSDFLSICSSLSFLFLMSKQSQFLPITVRTCRSKT